jgi:hypothetical protein
MPLLDSLPTPAFHAREGLLSPGFAELDIAARLFVVRDSSVEADASFGRIFTASSDSPTLKPGLAPLLREAPVRTTKLAVDAALRPNAYISRRSGKANCSAATAGTSVSASPGSTRAERSSHGRTRTIRR